MKATRVETETKLIAPEAASLALLPAALERLAEHVRPLGAVTIHDTYLDTADWWFYRAGLACRIRRQRNADDRRAQCWLMLKELARAAGGVAVRFELEEPLSRAPGPRLRRPPGKTLGRRLRALLGPRNLRRLFDVHNRRTLYEVRTGPLLAQVSADQVKFQAGPLGASQAEIELECLEGSAEPLAELAGRLKKAMGLKAAGQSKYERGLSLAGLSPPRPDDLRDVRLSPGDRTVDVAYRVLGAQTAWMLWNEPGTRLGLAPEFLHQMRVAIRRARAALRTFGRAIGQRTSEALRRRMAVVADALGQVRDLDVYLENLPDYAAHIVGGHGSEAIRRYQAHLTAQREQAREKLTALLDGKAYSAVLDRMQALLASGPPAAVRRADATSPIAAFARRAIRKRLKRVLRSGRNIRPDSPDAELHRLRLAVKRLRYHCEFIRPLLTRPARRSVRRLVGLQEVLGRFQDAIVATGLLEAFARTLKPDQAETAAILIDLGQLVGWQRSRQLEERAAFFRLWKKFDRKKVRRGLTAFLDRAAASVPTA